MDLLLEDWGKATWVKKIVKKVKVIVSFIWQHHVPLTIFCCFEINLMFLNLTKTWFATIFLMVERFFKLRLAIEQNVVDPIWINFCQHIVWHPSLEVPRRKLFKVTWGRTNFWDTCANFVHMVELILMLVRAFDGKQLYMGKTWFLMKTLEWHVLSLWEPPFELLSNLVDEI